MTSREAASWHRIFDDICVRRGASANAELAQRLCARKGRNSDRDYQAALRSIVNWRSGANLPQRSNFRLLTELLGIDADKALLARWRNAYQEATSTRQAHGEELPIGEAGIVTGVFEKPRFAVAAIAVVLLGAVLAGAWVYRGQGALESAVDDGGEVETTRTIGYRAYTELTVGQSAIINAKRGACGQPPPPWQHFEHELPLLLFGRLEDAGLGHSRSDTCGGLTPGRLVRYVATEPGTEIFDLFQRTLKVTVHPADADGK